MVNCQRSPTFVKSRTVKCTVIVILNILNPYNIPKTNYIIDCFSLRLSNCNVNIIKPPLKLVNVVLKLHYLLRLCLKKLLKTTVIEDRNVEVSEF